MKISILVYLCGGVAFDVTSARIIKAIEQHQDEGVHRTGFIGSSGSPLREELEQQENYAAKKMIDTFINGRKKWLAEFVYIPRT